MFQEMKILDTEKTYRAVIKKFPEVGDRVMLFSGEYDKEGDEYIITTSQILFVYQQTDEEKMQHCVRVLTAHSFGQKGGFAKLYRILY